MVAAMKVSAPDVPRRWSRRVTLKRNPRLRPLGEDDLKWLGAAWRRGGLRELGVPFTDENMPPGQFIEAARGFLGQFEGAWLLEAPASGGGAARPVGVVFAAAGGHLLSPHVAWFPWASARNRIEAAVK